MKKITLRGPWLLTLLLLLGWVSGARAQVTTDPVFFDASSTVRLIYDATQGNGAMANYAGDVYIWSGAITNLSADDTKWRYLAGNDFNNPSLAEKMTPLGNHKYYIDIVPNSFYVGLGSSGETLRKLAMVFRGPGGQPQGKGPGNADILVTVPSSALAVVITSPTTTGNNPNIVTAGSQVSVSAVSNTTGNLTLTLNGNPVATAANAKSITSTVTITQQGVNTLTVTNAAGGATASASTTVLVAPTPPTAALPSGAKPDGITYLAGGTSAILSFTAPNKGYVYVVGDFNNWQPTNATLMNQTATVNSLTDATSGRWWVQLNNLTPGQEYAYQFLVNGTQRVADPYCEKVLDASNDGYIPAVTYPNLKAYPTGQTTGIVSVLQTNQAAYSWSAATNNFVRPARTNLVVYELHLRDFIARHDYATLTDTLAYLKRLGVNAIELMPVNEFEGNDSWGYNPSFYFAPDKYYGTKTALKQFIDAAHARGMAVILDMVLNHSCGQSPMVQMYFDASTGKPSNNPWFNTDATHPFNVCYDFNHESPLTRYFSKQVMKFWLQEYKIDGYRFDLSKGFTQKVTTNTADWGVRDDSRIAIWQDYYNTLVATSPTMYPILEHLGNNDEEIILSNIGLMPWGNMSYNYQEADMGYGPGWNLNYGYYGNRGWSQPNLVTYMESHDEERTMYKNLTFGNSAGSYSVKDLPTALRRNEMAAALFFVQPGPRMVWQFGEVGYDQSIFTCANGTVPQPYGNDQCKTGAKPILWNYYQDTDRRHLYDVYRAMIALKKQPAVAAPSSYSQDLSAEVKQISLVGPGLSVVAFGNFAVTAQSATVVFPSAGTWYNHLTGSQLVVTNPGVALTLQPGQYGVYTSQRVSLAARPATEATALQLALAPNPASGTTTVSYELPAAATATLTVQNLLGQTVRTLTPARQAAGAQSQALPLQGLAAGLYVVKLTAGDATQTARLVVQ